MIVLIGDFDLVEIGVAHAPEAGSPVFIELVDGAILGAQPDAETGGGRGRVRILLLVVGELVIELPAPYARVLAELHRQRGDHFSYIVAIDGRTPIALLPSAVIHAAARRVHHQDFGMLAGQPDGR